MLDVVGGQELRQLRLDGLQLSELLDVGELAGVDRTVLVLDEDQDVDDADRSGVDEPEELRRHLAGEVLRAGRELDDHIVNRAEFVKRGIRHRRLLHSLAVPAFRRAMVGAMARACRGEGAQACGKKRVGTLAYRRQRRQDRSSVTCRGASPMSGPSDEVQRDVLPIPDRPYDGELPLDAKDPDGSFPPVEPLRPPAGARNVLVVLLDDAGFAAASAFGGPCATPTAERLAGNGLKYNRFHTTA